MALRGRSLYGRAWYRCHCGRRFRSTKVPEGMQVSCHSCGLLIGPESVVGPLTTWGGSREASWIEEARQRLSRSFEQDRLKAALSEPRENAVIEGAAPVAPSFVLPPPRVYTEDDFDEGWSNPSFAGLKPGADWHWAKHPISGKLVRKRGQLPGW